MTPRKIALFIRSESDPHSDYKLAVKNNDNEVDALERLTYTADLLSDDEYDYLMNRLKNRAEEVTVMVKRITRVREKGFTIDSFPDIEP